MKKTLPRSIPRLTERITDSEFQLNINRRTFLGRAAYGLGGMALACLLEPKLVGAAPSSPEPEH